MRWNGEIEQRRRLQKGQRTNEVVLRKRGESARHLLFTVRGWLAEHSAQHILAKTDLFLTKATSTLTRINVAFGKATFCSALLCRAALL